MNLGEIASKVARRHCDREHHGATPCVMCAQIRYIVVEGIGEFIGQLTREIHRNLDRLDEES